jgi:hypothetical protein
MHKVETTLVVVLVVVATMGCSSVTAATTVPTLATYTDPVAYCAAVGTVDAPGPQYTGPDVPESTALGLQKALNAPDTPIAVLQSGSSWRCMDGRVYACFVGANLPCAEKVDMDRTPSQAIKDYCEQNPNAAFILAAVTGRATAYEWQCQDGAPEIARQIAEPDARGFFADIWYEVGPN